MSTALTIPNELPKHLTTLGSMLQQFLDEATGGISSGMPPTIVAASGRFTQKEGGVDTEIVFPDTFNGQPHPAAGQPVTQLKVIVLRAKETLDKSWYAAAYSPGQEPQSPDCWSDDGIRPDPSCTSPQNASCAGCPQNMFGSGHDQNGQPSKGKACSDRKRLAIFAQNSEWRFVVPPASLQAWVAYCKQLKAYGLAPQFVITTIGFDDTDKYKLTFTFGGVLGETQVKAILEKSQSQEVLDIIGSRASAAPTPGQAAPAAATQNAGTPPVDPAAEEKKKKDAAAKAKKDAAAKAKAEKEAAEAADAAAAEAQQADLDLGDLGLEESAVEAVVAEVVDASEGPSQQELINELGLDL